MYAPGPESIDLMVPDSNAHFRDMMNSKSSDETKETNWPSVTGTFTKPKKKQRDGGRTIHQFCTNQDGTNDFPYHSLSVN